ncbi:MAG: helix-turn-helix transcriptional regulator [Mesorhizobium sp.]|nr:MAG: helix-turn-helix transcriptional regulator [Mesorhizobium sp.]TIW49309.1 MAG: helix-turn-helix transcriptional regulator [Mesorhizobium sp.]TIX73499.1 MAG: helix-turn-helix transcriptional regulator [Mesorhizobium sp.]
MWAVEPSRLANRSQLNRYLSGSSTPRPPLMRRICDYFSVENHEIRLPQSDFAAIVKLKGLAPTACRARVSTA